MGGTKGGCTQVGRGHALCIHFCVVSARACAPSPAPSRDSLAPAAPTCRRARRPCAYCVCPRSPSSPSSGVVRTHAPLRAVQCTAALAKCNVAAVDNTNAQEKGKMPVRGAVSTHFYVCVTSDYGALEGCISALYERASLHMQRITPSGGRRCSCINAGTETLIRCR